MCTKQAGISFVLFWLLSLSVIAQPVQIWQNRLYQNQYEKAILQQNSWSHLAIRPFRDSGLADVVFAKDSALVFPEISRKDNGPWKTQFFPLVDISAGFDSEMNSGIYHTGIGAGLQQKLGNKLLVYIDFSANQAQFPAYLQKFVDSTNVVPGLGYNLGQNSTRYLNVSGYLNYQPSKYFDFEIGYGKNFLGNGYRSLFLSDNAYNNPYGKITTSVWHIKYVNLYSAHQDIRNTEGLWKNYRYKFSSTHYLSWAVSKKVTVGVYETIIWQAKDSMSNRNFDVQYLNPVIFYRPVEYSLGSPDNALLGLNLSVQVKNNCLLYSQILIDEFLLGELRDGNGWWANKWGVQLGTKLYNPFEIDNAFAQFEVNVVRPFTYTHGSILQNFAHFNQPLAHPLGTNFYEGLSIFQHGKNRWLFENKFVYALYGRDPEGQNLGGDIYSSYVNPANIYGNTIAQGVQTRLIHNQLSAYYDLNNSIGLKLFTRYIYRDAKMQSSSETAHIFLVGVKSFIQNSYTDF